MEKPKFHIDEVTGKAEFPNVELDHLAPSLSDEIQVIRGMIEGLKQQLVEVSAITSQVVGVLKEARASLEQYEAKGAPFNVEDFADLLAKHTKDKDT